MDFFINLIKLQRILAFALRTIVRVFPAWCAEWASADAEGGGAGAVLDQQELCSPWLCWTRVAAARRLRARQRTQPVDGFDSRASCAVYLPFYHV
jgi:hypothetical protein